MPYMTIRDKAERDGVRYERLDDGKYVFYPVCCVCGEEFAWRTYKSNNKYTCKKCKSETAKIKRIEKQMLDNRSNDEIRFDNAIKKLRKQGADDSWNRAIRVAKTRSERYGSIPEAMFAIALLKNKYKIIPQQKIGKKKVDFAIPDKKLIIEVDGKVYHHSESEQLWRDWEIIQTIGISWTIIHISAEMIEENTENAVTYMETVYKSKARR